jgi:hypothetical protein
MAGPKLLLSDVERRLAINVAKAMLDEGEFLAKDGDMQGALALVFRANRKLIDVVESLEKDRGST